MFGKALPPAESAEGRRGRLNYSASVRTGGQVVGCGFAAPDNLWIAFGCGRRAALWGLPLGHHLAFGYRVRKPFTGSRRATRYGDPKAGASGSVAGPGPFRQPEIYYSTRA